MPTPTGSARSILERCGSGGDGLRPRRKRSSALRAALGALLLASAASSAAAVPAADDVVSPIRTLLPALAELGDWTVKDPPQTFERDDLFLYINGGAEIYHEYGFARVLVQDYWRGDDSISLEIFEMTSSAAAFGIFTFKRGPAGEAVDIGTGASLEGYYLNFWEGRFLVTLTGMNASDATVGAILAAARSVASRIGDAGGEPALVKALPPEGLVPSSVKYIKGSLGLHNIYPFFRGDVLAFREGVNGDYAAGHSLFILAYGSAEAATAALDRAERAFREGTKYRGLARDGAALRISDEDARTFRLAVREDVLIVVSGASSPEAEAVIVAAAASRALGRVS
jgi:hypothetical protein